MDGIEARIDRYDFEDALRRALTLKVRIDGGAE
jgi:hypothetical protein